MKKSIIIILFTLYYAGFSQKIDITPVDFNSSRDDFGTAFAQNGRVLFFTSERSRSYQKVFVTERTSRGWASPDYLNKEINAGSQNGSVTVTPDGQYMVFASFEHEKPGSGRTDLYSAKKIDGEWTAVRNLGPAINSGYWDSQPTITSDGQTLYFASNRPGGFGGVDIYISRKTRDGWSAPENAGSQINTASNEMAPVIGSDNKTFTFSSDRPGGQGGYDIYVTKISGRDFSTPKNAGSPINSASDEFFYYGMPNSKVAYFSSDRPGGEGGLDIYMAVPNPFESDAVVLLSGIVSDAVTKDPLGADITVTDLKTGKKVGELRSDDRSGYYYVVLQPGRVYSITASKKGYLFYSERFEIEPTEKGHEETKDIRLSPLAGGGVRLLVYFDFDKSVLKDESIPELERVIEFLKENPNIKVSLEGHTDDVGEDAYNQKLSTSRANAVRDYLVAGGIDGSRIRTIGYGESRPLVKETTEEARALNRRVEMKIID